MVAIYQFSSSWMWVYQERVGQLDDLMLHWITSRVFPCACTDHH